MTLMTDPVVLSSGIILDRTTVCDNDGNIKLPRGKCPYTNQDIDKKVYPAQFLKAKIIDWLKARFENAITIAERYSKDK